MSGSGARPLVRLDRPSDHVALVTVDSPPMNAFGAAESEAMHTVLDAIDGDNTVRCTIVTGSGPSFTAGADLNDQAALLSEDLEAHLDDPRGFGAAMARLEQARYPVIGAINGYSLGGGFELALCCDIRLASTKARFACSAVNVGLILSWYRLPRVVGIGRAKEMLLSGAFYDADTAERWGLVTAVHEPERLVPAAIELAERIASRAPLSVEATKQCAARSFDIGAKEAAALQRDKFLALAETQDHAEAIRSVVEKRTGTYERR